MSKNQLAPTPAERLRVYRRRQDITQGQMATRIPMGRERYRDMENGVRPLSKSCMTLADRVTDLLEHEVLWIRRHRAGLSRSQLAKRVQVTKQWLTQMEHGEAPVDTLRAFWDQQR